MLEPMSLSKAVIIGPYAFNFKEIVQAAKEMQALLEVQDAEELASTVQLLLSSVGKRNELAQNAYTVATSEMTVLDRVYECLKIRGIV